MDQSQNSGTAALQGHWPIDSQAQTGITPSASQQPSVGLQTNGVLSMSGPVEMRVSNPAHRGIASHVAEPRLANGAHVQPRQHMNRSEQMSRLDQPQTIAHDRSGQVDSQGLGNTSNSQRMPEAYTQGLQTNLNGHAGIQGSAQYDARFTGIGLSSMPGPNTLGRPTMYQSSATPPGLHVANQAGQSASSSNLGYSINLVQENGPTPHSTAPGSTYNVNVVQQTTRPALQLPIRTPYSAGKLRTSTTCTSNCLKCARTDVWLFHEFLTDL